MDKANEDDSMEDDLKILVNLPKDGWDDDKSFWPITNFIGKYVAKLYGKRKIDSWSKTNKGKSFLSMITTSDIAYCLTVMVNNYDVWDQWFKIKDHGKEELDKYKVKNQSNMTNEEKATYLRNTPKFTSKKEKKTYLDHGFSRTGVVFYNEKWKMWRLFSSDREKWDKLEICWEEYVTQTGFGRQWKSISDAEDYGYDVEDEAQETTLVAHFAMPGDDDFEGDCPWKGDQDETLEEEEEIGEDEAAAGNQGMGERKYTHEEVEKEGRIQHGGSDESSSESEEDEFDVVKVTPGNNSKKRRPPLFDDPGEDEDESPLPKKALSLKKKRPKE